MKKLSRRELFKRTGQVGVGGAALAVGLTPVSKSVLAGGRVGKSVWKPITNLTPTSNVISFGKTDPAILRLWSKMVLEEIRKVTLMSGDLNS